MAFSSGEMCGASARWRGRGHLLLADSSRFGEFAPDGKGGARVLDVEEECLAVGGEGRAGDFRLEVDRQPFLLQSRVGEVVQRHHVAFAFRGEADDAIDPAAVFGNEYISPWGNGDIVRAFEAGVVQAGIAVLFSSTAILTLVEELEHVGGRCVSEGFGRGAARRRWCRRTRACRPRTTHLETVEAERALGVLVTSDQMPPTLRDTNPKGMNDSTARLEIAIRTSSVIHP